MSYKVQGTHMEQEVVAVVDGGDIVVVKRTQGAGMMYSGDYS